MINAPDYIEEQALIVLYRMVTDALVDALPDIPDQPPVFEGFSAGFFEVSQKCSAE